MKLYQDAEWLRQHYVKDGLSTRKIASLAGCSRSTIRCLLHKFEIPVRTKSEAARLHCADPTYRQRRSDAAKARWARGVYDGDTYRQKRRTVAKAAWERGAYDDRFTDEVRQKISDSQKVRYADPTERQRTGNITKAAWRNGVFDDIYTPEYCQKLSDASKAAWESGAFDSDEYRQKKSGAAKAAWARGDFDGVFQSPTTIEIAVVQALEALGVAHECEYRPPGYTRIYDVLVYPDILIEVQGDYWHTKDGTPERDAEKAAWARGQGFVVIELWGHDIREAEAAGTMADFVRGHIEAAYA